MGRLGSRVWASASFKIFALTAGGNVLGKEGNCPAREMCGRICQAGKCPGEMSCTVCTQQNYSLHKNSQNLCDLECLFGVIQGQNRKKWEFNMKCAKTMCTFVKWILFVGTTFLLIWSVARFLCDSWASLLISVLPHKRGLCRHTVACHGGAIGSVAGRAALLYGDRRVWIRGSGWADYCVRLWVGYTIVVWSGIRLCSMFSAINWSRFSGVCYGTLFHSRHCVDR